MIYFKKTIILLFLSGGLIFAASKYTASFLELGVGARALAMGGSYVALSDDAYGNYWNPSGVAFLKNYQAAAMYADGFDSFEKHHFINISAPIFGGATISVSWIRLSVDDIPRFEALNNTPNSRLFGVGEKYTQESQSSFSSTSDAFLITFAKYQRLIWDLGWQYFELPVDFGYGINFKSINENILNNSGSGLGIDLGVIFRVELANVFNEEGYGDLYMGINAQDIVGTTITWDTNSKQKDEVERNFKIGFAYKQPLNFIQSQLTLTYDLNTKYEGTNHLGAEFLYNSLLAVRVGLNDGSFTTGAGLMLWKFGFDYAYQGHDDLGNTHRVSLLVEL
jgi:hypothetical protein